MNKMIFMGLVLILSVGCLGAQNPGAGERKARQMLQGDQPGILLDVRTPGEYSSGHIPGALLLPFDQITAETAAKFIPDKNTPVVLYCRSGNRSGQAARNLKSLGYQVIFDLGPVGAWSGVLKTGMEPGTFPEN